MKAMKLHLYFACNLTYFDSMYIDQNTERSLMIDLACYIPLGDVVSDEMSGSVYYFNTIPRPATLTSTTKMDNINCILLRYTMYMCMYSHIIKIN